jgi:hypothetical protein
MRDCDRKSSDNQVSARMAFIKRRNFAQVERVAACPFTLVLTHSASLTYFFHDVIGGCDC